MNETRALIIRATASDATLAERHDAFGEIVTRFQNMAYACAYAVLGDFCLAQDAAQEAFISAWLKLHQLQQPEAFPGWFRRIVLTECNRLMRGKRLQIVPLEVGASVASADPDPHLVTEKHELQEKVQASIKALPEGERMVTTLFYVDGYSQKEISEFLEVPLTTVAKRLYSARDRLQENMFRVFRNNLEEQRPSRDEKFVDEVMTKLRPFNEQDWETVAAIAYSLEPDFRGNNDEWLRNRQCFDEARFVRRHYVAEHTDTGQVLGYGSIEQSIFLPKFRLFLVADPKWLRGGVGDLLLDRLMSDLREVNARTVSVRQYAHLTDFLAFLEEHGFREAIRVWDLRLTVSEADLSSFVPIAEKVSAQGIQITTVEEERKRDPDCLHKLHEFLNLVKADDPARQPFTPLPFEAVKRWFEQTYVLRDACFIAKHNDLYIGFADLNLLEAVAGGLTHGFTGVRREYRRQGVATVMKVRAIEYAREHGYKTVRTFNRPAHSSLLALNEKLGFRRLFSYVTLEKDLKETIKVDSKIYDAYVGQYRPDPEFLRTITNEEDQQRLSSYLLSITKEGDRLLAETAGQKFELFPESKTTFFVKEFYGQGRFVKDKQGQVTHLIHHERDQSQQEHEIRWKKIK